MHLSDIYSKCFHLKEIDKKKERRMTICHRIAGKNRTKYPYNSVVDLKN